jgi:hypothetical protein
MLCVVRRKSLAAVAALAVIGTASVAAAQGADAYRNARRLGGSTSFYRPPLRTPASLKRFAANKRVVADIRNVLGQAGVDPDVTEKIVSTLTNPTEIVKGQSCAESTPADGTIVDCKFRPGETMEWMAFRPRIKGKPTPSLLRKLRWSGRAPFDAYLFRVTTADKIHTFMVPKPCGNLTLVSTQDIVKTPVNVTVDRNCTPDGKLTATVRATGDTSKIDRVRVSINGTPAGELTGPSWSLTSTQPGTYTFQATDKAGNPYPVSQTSVTVDPCPAPPPPPQVVNPTCRINATALKVKGGYELTLDATGSSTGTTEVAPTVVVEVYDPTGAMVGQRVTLDNTLTGKVTIPRKPAGTYRIKAIVTTPREVVSGGNRYTGESTCEATITPPPPTTAGPSFFVEGAFGKERRERPVSELDTVPPDLPASATFGQCSPLLGLKAGVAKRFENDWEVAGDVGVGIMFVDDDKVNKSPLFIDVEANKYLANGMFLGTGISFWDLTRSETFTPAWLFHFGVPLNKDSDSKARFYFIGEGRLFFDNIDSIDNNYQFWGGVRVHFPIGQ